MLSQIPTYMYLLQNANYTIFNKIIQSVFALTSTKLKRVQTKIFSSSFLSGCLTGLRYTSTFPSPNYECRTVQSISSCDWKQVKHQRCALRTGSIVKKSWPELTHTDRPHQRNMAVTVAPNQAVGRTEKCQDCPMSVLSVLNPLLTHSMDWKTLKGACFFYVCHFRTQVVRNRKWTNICFLMSHCNFKVPLNGKNLNVAEPNMCGTNEWSVKRNDRIFWFVRVRVVRGCGGGAFLRCGPSLSAYV